MVSGALFTRSVKTASQSGLNRLQTTSSGGLHKKFNEFTRTLPESLGESLCGSFFGHLLSATILFVPPCLPAPLILQPPFAQVCGCYYVSLCLWCRHSFPSCSLQYVRSRGSCRISPSNNNNKSNKHFSEHQVWCWRQSACTHAHAQTDSSRAPLISHLK